VNARSAAIGGSHISRVDCIASVSHVSREMVTLVALCYHDARVRIFLSLDGGRGTRGYGALENQRRVAHVCRWAFVLLRCVFGVVNFGSHDGD
jgi:hypothetical protein